MVLIRADANHAELTGESFHIMEVESEGQETGRVYKMRKWDDHSKVFLAHSTALMKASDFVLSHFTKLDASEKELVAHNLFQLWPGLLAERQAHAPAPVLVTTPRGQPKSESPSPPRSSSNKQNRMGDGVQPAPGLGQPPEFAPSGPPPSKNPPFPSAINRTAMPGMQVENWGTAAKAKAAGGGGYQIQGDRNEVWPHEPRLADVLETTDIFRFPETGMGPYKTIFVCCQCLAKWRSPSGTGGGPYVSRLGFQFFLCQCVLLFLFFVFNTRVQVTSAAHFRTKRGPWAGGNHREVMAIGRNPDAPVAPRVGSNGPHG